MKRSVMATVENVDNSEVEIRLDDLVLDVSQGTWLKDELLTSKRYSSECFEELDFDEKELADFGYYIMARLHAFRDRSEN